MGSKELGGEAKPKEAEHEDTGYGIEPDVKKTGGIGCCTCGIFNFEFSQSCQHCQHPFCFHCFYFEMEKPAREVRKPSQPAFQHEIKSFSRDKSSLCNNISRLYGINDCEDSHVGS